MYWHVANTFFQSHFFNSLFVVLYSHLPNRLRKQPLPPWREHLAPSTPILHQTHSLLGIQWLLRISCWHATSIWGLTVSWLRVLPQSSLMLRGTSGPWLTNQTSRRSLVMW
jgi:hypothetical protein